MDADPDPADRAYTAGLDAYTRGDDRRSNPNITEPERASWRAGWDAGAIAKAQRKTRK